MTMVSDPIPQASGPDASERKKRLHFCSLVWKGAFLWTGVSWERPLGTLKIRSGHKDKKNFNQAECGSWQVSTEQRAAKWGTPRMAAVREEFSAEGIWAKCWKTGGGSPVEKIREAVSGRGKSLDKGLACLWLLPLRWAASRGPWAVFAFHMSINIHTQCLAFIYGVMIVVTLFHLPNA